MGKLKNKKSLAKRIKVTKKGKVMRSKAGRRHLLSTKTRKRKRNLRRRARVAGIDAKTVKRALAY